MRRLRGSLNVAQFRGAYEDNDDVYITMEWCKGGELWHRIGRAHYSEQTVRHEQKKLICFAHDCKLICFAHDCTMSSNHRKRGK